MVWPLSQKLRSKLRLSRFSRAHHSHSAVTTSAQETSIDIDAAVTLTPSEAPHALAALAKPPSPSHVMCPACQDLAIDEASGGDSRVITVGFANVQRRAKAGCVSCGMIKKACISLGAAEPLLGWRTIWRTDMSGDSESAWAARGEDGVPRSHTKETYVDMGDLDVEIRIEPATGPYAPEPQVLVILIGITTASQERQRSQPVELYRPRLRDKPSPRLPWPAIGAAPSVPRLSEDPACTSSARGWLEECISNHPECRKQGGINTPLPARVLDVSGSQVRLLETKGLQAQYLTLSYCWGPPTTHRLVTLQANLASHLKGIEWGGLGKTHQDAITLTRRLGQSYIWIDALCIVQDSPDDWAVTAGRMADIYENSLLTICATWSPDSGGGLFSDRHAHRRDTVPAKAKPLRVCRQPQVDARLVFTTHFWENGFTEARDLGVVPTAASDPLLTRAWCMQERLLSPRILEFTLEEMRWECRRSRRCECGQSDRRAAPPPRLPLAEQPADEGTAAPWLNLVSAYSAMAITYTRDRLPALSGLAHHYYGLYGDLPNQRGYLAGIWQQNLLPSLLWYIEPHVGGGPDGAAAPHHVPPQDYQAPSWSWASREGQAVFTKFEPDADLQVIASSCTYESDICGRCTGGSLTLRGRLAQVKLLYGTTKYEGKETAFMQRWRKNYWIRKDELSTYIRADAEIGVPGHADHLPLDAPLYCLRFGWETLEGYPHPRASCGLVLRKDAATGQYSRIAKFTKHDTDKLLFMRRPKPNGNGMEDVVHYDDFFDGAELTVVDII